MRRGKILLIDDNERDIFITKELLEKVGYEIIENFGWLGATKNIKKFNPDLILLDVCMPGLSGDNLYRIFKEESMKRKIPVLFYSSLDEGCLRKLMLNEKLLDYIVKGDVFQLYKKISYYMKKQNMIN